MERASFPQFPCPPFTGSRPRRATSIICGSWYNAHQVLQATDLSERHCFCFLSDYAPFRIWSRLSFSPLDKQQILQKHTSIYCQQHLSNNPSAFNTACRGYGTPMIEGVGNCIRRWTHARDLLFLFPTSLCLLQPGIRWQRPHNSRRRFVIVHRTVYRFISA